MFLSAIDTNSITIHCLDQLGTMQAIELTSDAALSLPQVKLDTNKTNRLYYLNS